MIEYLQSRPTNPERLRLLSFYGHTSKFKKSPVRRKLCWFNYDNTFSSFQIWVIIFEFIASNWSMMIIISQ